MPAAATPDLVLNWSFVQLTILPPVEELQTDPETRAKWIDYSAYDAKATWQLAQALRKALMVSYKLQWLCAACWNVCNVTCVCMCVHSLSPSAVHKFMLAHFVQTGLPTLCIQFKNSLQCDITLCAWLWLQHVAFLCSSSRASKHMLVTCNKLMLQPPQVHSPPHEACLVSFNTVWSAAERAMQHG